MNARGGSFPSSRPARAVRALWFVLLIAAVGLGACVQDYRVDGIKQASTEGTTALAPSLAHVRAQLNQPEIVALPSHPHRLEIPALQIDSVIEAVGRGDDDAMDLPSHWDTTAWYAPGTRPGQLGNAVIAGHLNTPRDRPAVFWGLDTLQKGDAVYVHDADGTMHIFQVERVRAFPYDAAPLHEIFGFTPHARRLNLITCAGEWNRAARNYTQRLVVETVLQESVPPAPHGTHMARATGELDISEQEASGTPQN